MSAGANDFRGTKRFEVVRLLGEGGMGLVYEVLDRERGLRVALKTLRQLTGDALYRFKNEFRALQDLQHPNLVTLGELIQEEGRWFFTMELVEGVDFVTWVRPNAPPVAQDGPTRGAQYSFLSPAGGTHVGDPVRGDALPAVSPIAGYDEARLRACFTQLARGLVALHAVGKLHRDIKPSNIRVTPEGRVALLDFGLVVDFQANQAQSGEWVVGTALYMAPEQAAAKPLGPEADWYAAGVVLYEALVGCPPFSGPPLEILMDKQRRLPRPPRALVPTVPADLDALCADLLQTRPSKRPSGRAVLGRLRIEGVAEGMRGAAGAGKAPFVGRLREQALLRAAFEDSRAAPVTLLIRGESGVGKTMLARRFAERVVFEYTGALVLAGRCYERELVPYKAFDGVVDALSRHLRRLNRAEAEALLPPEAGLLGYVFPVLRHVEPVAMAPRRLDVDDPRELRRRLFAALRELLRRLAAKSPLVLVIDDLQWADADGMALLAEVLRPPDAPRLLLCATVRAGAALAPLPGDVRILELGGLPPDEARELVTVLVEKRGGEPADLAGLAEEAGGHPMFIDELVRGAADRGRAERGPLRLEDALWARIRQLDGSSTYLLELAAVAGAPLTQEVAARAAECDLGEFQKQVAVLRAANLARTTGARGADLLEPYHDRVRAAVLAHLTPESLRVRHRRLALALEASRDADPEALAVHWQGAGVRERAAQHAEQAAAQAALALAFDRAARLYGLALELTPPARSPGSGARRRDLHEKVGDALASAGRAVEASKAYLEAAAVSPADQALDLRRRAAEQLLRSGHADEGLAIHREVLAALGMKIPATPTGALASLVVNRTRIRVRGLDWTERAAAAVAPQDLARVDACASVSLGLAMIDPLRGADFQARHLVLALAAGEPFRVTRALALEATYSAVAGGKSAKRTARLLAAAAAAGRRAVDPRTEGFLGVAAGTAAFLEGRFRDARALLEQAEDNLRRRCTGVTWELHNAEQFGCLTLVQLGELAELARRIPALRRAAGERGDLYAAATFRMGRLSMFELAADAPERVPEAIREVAWPKRGAIQELLELQSLAMVDLYRGDGAAALAGLSARLPRIGRLVLRLQGARIDVSSLVGTAALAAAARAQEPAERRRCLAIAARQAARIAREKMPWADPLAELLHAGVQVARGAPGSALARLAKAEAGFAASDQALHVAVARWRAGHLVGGAEGALRIAEAEAWMRGQDVRSPERMCDLLAPGFDLVQDPVI